MSDSEKKWGPLGGASPGEGLSESGRVRIHAEEEDQQQVWDRLSGTLPPPADTPPPPPTRLRLDDDATSHRRQLAGLLIIPLVLLGFWACDSFVSPGMFTTAGGERLTYSVSSTCPVDVTYTVGREVQEESGVQSGWTRTVQSSDFANVLTGQLQCDDGTVTVTISGGRWGTKSEISNRTKTSAKVTYP